jgi:hypothetical protein
MPDADPSPSPQARRQRQALWAALVLVVIWGANFSVQKAVFVALVRFFDRDCRTATFGTSRRFTLAVKSALPGGSAWWR